MPPRDSAPPGAPVWIDLASSDPERGKGFYSDLFGWTIDQAGEEFGNYVNFSKNGVLIAGMVGAQPGSPDAWTTYLASADAKASADAVTTAGGQVFSGPHDVGEIGTMAVAADPSGAVVGIWQPGTHQGFGLVGEDGTPLWHELHTRDYAAAVSFYQQAFGWEISVMSDTDEFRYAMATVGGQQQAGMMDAASFLPPGTPSTWQVYFGAADVDATLARVVELGGVITQAAEDTPYGRLAQAADPMGASFRLSSLRA